MTPHEEAGWDMYRNTHKELRLLRIAARKHATNPTKETLARLEEILDRHNDYK
jgi:hypothetical protein